MIMNKAEQMIKDLQKKLTDTLTSNSSQEEINNITNFTNELDNIKNEFKALSEELSETKGILVDYVKRGVDTKTPPEDTTNSNTFPEFESFVEDKLKEIRNKEI